MIMLWLNTPEFSYSAIKAPHVRQNGANLESLDGYMILKTKGKRHHHSINMGRVDITVTGLFITYFSKVRSPWRLFNCLNSMKLKTLIERRKFRGILAHNLGLSFLSP